MSTSSTASDFDDLPTVTERRRASSELAAELEAELAEDARTYLPLSAADDGALYRDLGWPVSSCGEASIVTRVSR